jgi:hypothetical protein
MWSGRQGARRRKVVAEPGQADGDDESVDSLLSHWRQGDCVLGEQWFVHRFASDRPITRAASELAGQGVDLAESQVAGLVVLTQTCDVVRRCADRPFVEVAPLVEIDPAERAMVARGRRPFYAMIPALADRGLAADLDRTMTVEKPVVATWTRTPGCGTDAEARSFARSLARKRARFAFPDDFSRWMKKLQDRLSEKHGKASSEGAALRALREIRVLAAPDWDAQAVEVMFWFIRDGGVADFEGQSWDHYLEFWLRLVPAAGRFSRVDGLVVELGDLTAKDYLESDQLDLDHLSSSVA